LRATACEIYNDNVYDLLGAEKLECTLRTDSAGQLVVMGPPQTSMLEGAETGIPEELLSDDKSAREMHATILTGPRDCVRCLCTVSRIYLRSVAAASRSAPQGHLRNIHKAAARTQSCEWRS
jgi:hypothetical protein